MRLAIPAGVVVCTLVCGAARADGQDTTRGVHIGLRYVPGTKPGVLILPIPGVGGDSVHTIIQRDLDYGDRVTLIGAADSGIALAGVNYALVDKLGAAAVVQAFLGPTTLHVILHDVGNRRVLQVRDFALPPALNGPDWRLAIHGASDELERWITGARGISQTRISFVRDGQIYITDSDGANARPVTPRGAGPLSPAWHPSGRYLTYSAFTPRGTQIVVQDLTTGATRPLVATPTGLNITPIFSPDGNAIAYVHGEENGTDLFLAPAFTNDPARRITVGHGTDNTQPTFRPDGRSIAFTSGRSGHPEVYITDVDGTNAELLTPYEFGDDNYRASPDWSPDGRVIAYQARISGQFQVMTINVRDRGIKQLTSDGINEDPSWAPDSRHVVFTSNRSGVRQLWVLDVESSRTRQLTFGGAARLAAWSRSLGTP
jgi:TolB protein